MFNGNQDFTKQGMYKIMKKTLLIAFLTLFFCTNVCAYSYEPYETYSYEQNYYSDYSDYEPSYSSYYGEISEKTGRRKTVPVRRYKKKDGTQVSKHYRSTPGRKR